MVSYSEIIEAPLEKVWEHFIYKIEHPENFVPGVSNVVMKEKTDDFVIRQMDISLPNQPKVTVTEKITHSPYQVNFLIIDHPIYKGFVDNFAEKISRTTTKITFSLNWVAKETGEAVNTQDIVRNAVLKTVDYILRSTAGK